MAIPEMNEDREGGEGAAARAVGSGSEGAPTQALAVSTVGDRCVNCGAPLSSDQRYCVNCGERRTKPRFSLSDTSAATAAPPAGRRPPRWSRPSSGATLVAGVGTLLLAMGVGVLIGRTNSNGNAKAAAAPAVRIVTVNNGASSGAGTATSSSPSTGTGKKSKSKSSGSAAKAANSKPVTPTQAKQAGQAASKVLGGKNLPPPTVTVGQKGSGPGYNKQGQFNGSFFGQ